MTTIGKVIAVGAIGGGLYLGYRYFLKTRTPAGSPGLTQPANQQGLNQDKDIAKSALDVLAQGLKLGSSLAQSANKKDENGSTYVEKATGEEYTEDNGGSIYGKGAGVAPGPDFFK